MLITSKHHSGVQACQQWSCWTKLIASILLNAENSEDSPAQGLLSCCHGHHHIPQLMELKSDFSGNHNSIAAWFCKILGLFNSSFSGEHLPCPLAPHCFRRLSTFGWIAIFWCAASFRSFDPFMWQVNNQMQTWHHFKGFNSLWPSGANPICISHPNNLNPGAILTYGCRKSRNHDKHKTIIISNDHKQNIKGHNRILYEYTRILQLDTSWDLFISWFVLRTLPIARNPFHLFMLLSLQLLLFYQLLVLRLQTFH